MPRTISVAFSRRPETLAVKRPDEASAPRANSYRAIIFAGRLVALGRFAFDQLQQPRVARRPARRPVSSCLELQSAVSTLKEIRRILGRISGFAK